ncbi:hypothetical protein [Spiroplasma endosymbiont of Dromius quadrimaculatus]|uniref:hypothetical protein n=1 Tax=Spiroplasma endosymbiont of Dromius quadrimaculatus TaxID=3066283 RepID=UPI00313B2F38
MKKLLSLLSTITMAGSGMSGIVGNAPTSTKSEISYLKTNNLKNLDKKVYFIEDKPNNYDAIEISEIKGQVNDIAIHDRNIKSTVAGATYFATDDGLYFKSRPSSNLIKINAINNKVNRIIISQSTGEAYAISANKKIYLIEDKPNNYDAIEISEIKGQVNDIAIHDRNIKSTVAGATYFATDDGLYFKSRPSSNLIKINGINNKVNRIIISQSTGEAYAISANKKIYLIEDKPNNYDAIEISEIKGQVNDIAIHDRNIKSTVAGATYFATDDGLYFKSRPSSNLIKINGINEAVISIIIEQKSGNVFAITKTKMLLNIIIQINNLRFNNIINDEIILNELNYLNPNLDISQLEIINKTDTSATIKAKDNGKYFGEVTVNYKIKNKDEINAINLNELIKRAVFFKFRDENPNLKFKEIKYIDTNNLNFSNTEITKRENSFLWSNAPKNVCSDREIINKTPNTRSFNVPTCEYNSKSKLVFQITTGLTKTKQENKLNGWNINSDDEMKLTDFTNINNKNSKIINVLSNEFDLSNTNKQEQEMILSIFKVPADKFELNPNEKLKITYPVRIITSKVILNLKQKITGNITAKIIDDNNKEQVVTLSITEVMQILQKYSLLPNEITIDKNNDNITFNGEAFFSSEREGPVKTNTVTTIV